MKKTKQNKKKTTADQKSKDTRRKKKKKDPEDSCTLVTSHGLSNRLNKFKNLNDKIGKLDFQWYY